MALLRVTLGTCPTCLAAVPASLVLEDGMVHLVKHCPEHGDTSTLVAKDGPAWAELAAFYEEMMAPLPGIGDKNLNLPLTDRCNLACPICFTRSGPRRGDEREPSPGDVARLLAGVTGAKVQLYGGEPTVRNDLPDIVTAVIASGNVPVLATNGLLLAEEGVLDELRAAGLGEVHIQLDGLSGQGDNTLRGRDVSAVKRKALEALEKAGMPTGLECTLARDVNDGAVAELLTYALDHHFVRGVFFRSYGHLGIAGLGPTARLRVEEVVSMVADASNGRITPAGWTTVQKALYAAFNLLGVPSCLYNQFYPVLRRPDGTWTAAEELVDVEGLDDALERFRVTRHRLRWGAAAQLATEVLPLVREPGLVRTLLSAAVQPLAGVGPLDTLATPGLLVVGAGSLCDPDTFDLTYSLRCDAGLVVRDGEPWLTQSLDTLREERRHGEG
ncbi:MAG: radical SAM protein [Candidatus Undinarchaeales archaeon]|jgi:MoaA/NifB/PqqE/SkfB family radical SAM enzyme|nr:radical SAM protein [Candidatus Undinarchaeales archaeon]MDP7492122.1 radical SAM protein [Candidatus Undinarchaeales archaeon]